MSRVGPEVRSSAGALVVAELSAMLEPRSEPKTFCNDQRTREIVTRRRFRRDLRRRVVVASCTLDRGHDDDHTDAHTGHRWRNR